MINKLHNVQTPDEGYIVRTSHSVQTIAEVHFEQLGFMEQD